jgi:hypothetical protein
MRLFEDRLTGQEKYANFAVFPNIFHAIGQMIHIVGKTFLTRYRTPLILREGGMVMSTSALCRTPSPVEVFWPFVSATRLQKQQILKNRRATD